MQITLDVPHVFYKDSPSEEDGQALRVLLNALIELDVAYLRTNSVPSLHRSGVVYRRTKVFDTIPALYARGFGDCKSLTAARVAELRAAGANAEPVFRWIRRDDGGKNFHILVQTDDGFEDPSRDLGMGRDENAQLRA